MTASVQLYMDYRDEIRGLQAVIERILEATRPPAAKAVHTLDEELAAEVVHGVLSYEFIQQVSIQDEMGKVLASASQTPRISNTLWLTRLIGDSQLTFTKRLHFPIFEDNSFGLIELMVDVDWALGGFYRRSGLVVATGFLRNVVLILLLFAVFYRVLAKPLAKLSKEIKSINPDHPGEKRLTPIEFSGEHELAQVIESSNSLLDAVDLSLAKRRSIELALRKSEQHVRQIMDSLPVLVGARNRDGVYIFANHALAKFLGTSVDDIQGRSIHDYGHLYLSDLSQLQALDLKVIESGRGNEVIDEIYMIDNGRHYLQTHIMPLDFNDEVVSLSVSTDVTEQRRAQAKMEHMAYHDSLTNLPNRLQLVERLEHELRRAQRHHYYGAVLFIDLDQFKTINDSLGHPVGDAVLKEMAARLSNSVRQEDLVARQGGDEFVVILTVLDTEASVAALKAGEIAEKIRQRLSAPFYYGEMELRVTCSVGVVIYPDQKASVHELLSFADTAMYQVKDKGRDAVEFFNEGMADQVSRQLTMEGDLHRAIESNQFELYYQPKIDTNDLRLVGAEALIRWRHPSKGMISPAEFIPVLETSGQIIEVGGWIIEQACQALQRWQLQGLWREGMRLSINISPRQFRSPSFVKDVVDVLQCVDIPPQSLDMEVTEGVVIQGVEETINKMRSLIQSGVSFSLDDFGTGYSSISYLKRLPVTTLKIDKSFVRDIAENHSDRVLVETIIAMGRLLGLELVAEGVETEEQLQLLREYGCPLFQGYYISPPVNEMEFSSLLAGAETLEPALLEP
ncbi:MAG: EAL domain-containing protein [Cellvibrionaceae bacterium]|nr:EAL domain-containing protein [Cellvibrionaceae bacterium]